VEVTPAAIPGPVFTLRRPPVKPVIPLDLEPMYHEQKSEKGQIRYSQYDERGDEEAQSPTSATTLFFKALVERGKREMQSLRNEVEEKGRQEEKKWGGIRIGARMSALAKRAKRAVERELDSEDEEEVEVVPHSPGSPVPVPVSRSDWPRCTAGTAKTQGVVMPLKASEFRREKEMVFVIGDEEDP
jgi:CRISPR/Cas system-associated protein Cas5 (RAMP superfamily)